MTKEKIKPLDEKELEALKVAYLMGATNTEARFATGISAERQKYWLVECDGEAQIKEWKVAQQWEEKKKIYLAKNKFLEPQEHREAEAVLKRHPLTKKEYCDKVEQEIKGDLTHTIEKINYLLPDGTES